MHAVQGGDATEVQDGQLMGGGREVESDTEGTSDASLKGAPVLVSVVGTPVQGTIAEAGDEEAEDE